MSAGGRDALRPLSDYPDAGWLGREDSNLRMAEPKSAALPLGHAPSATSIKPAQAAA